MSTGATAPGKRLATGDSDSLLVGWLPTPDRDPGEPEAQLLTEFIGLYGKRPFANRNRGRRLT